MEVLHELLGTGLHHLKQRCTRAEKFDPDLLDNHQQSCYDLAFCAAELSAERAITTYADRFGSNALVTGLAAAFRAEIAGSVLARLQIRAVDLNLNEESLAAASVLVRRLQLDESTLTDIGTALLEAGSEALPTGLGSEIDLVRQTFARFADTIVAPLAESIHRDDTDIPASLIEAAAELGCFGTCIPQRFGGLQDDAVPDSLGMIVVTEQLSRGSLGAAGSLITRPEIAARALLAGGTELQQRTWLPRLAAGELLCAISITEPDTGSDVAAVSLRASRTDGGWLLNGSKTWCTFAGRSELLVVLARTNPDKSQGYRGLSLFLIEKPAYAGHQFVHTQAGGGKLEGKAIATLGYRGMHSYDLFFTDYFVPEANLVGAEAGEGQGFYYTMAGFSGGRIQTAARAIGVMQAAFDRALEYAAQRKTFGKVLSANGLIRNKLVRMLANLTASRQFSYAVARLLDAGGGQMEASLVKLFTCRTAEWITREAMQIHGGMGYAEESAVSRYFVDARVLSIFEGAEEVLALKVIARTLIANA